MRQHGLLTPEFQLFETGREKVSPSLRYPVIVKPNAEGSSKWDRGQQRVRRRGRMRVAVKALIEKYRQPALVEEYVTGREFTVGLLGDRRPRVLPPMEIIFKDKAKDRPVYDFQVKQEWEKHVEYKCPAEPAPTELRTMERMAREVYDALDCRDVARIDFKMNAKGEVYVLEVNPLPGLTAGLLVVSCSSPRPPGSLPHAHREVLSGGLSGCGRSVAKRRSIASVRRARRIRKQEKLPLDRPQLPS